MIPILTREQMRAYDAHAIDNCHIASLVLMENAGRGAAEVIAEQVTDGPVVLVCGHGNNGGVGLVGARHLLAASLDAEVYVLGEREAIAGDARINLEALIGLGGNVHFLGDDLEPLRTALIGANIAVDAIFGTGLTREVAGPQAHAIELLNDALSLVVALDMPSGIDATTGAVLGKAIEADTTVTFGHLKTGLIQGPGAKLAGNIEIVDLGMPDADILSAVGQTATAIDADDVNDTLGDREVDYHKYHAGSVLVIAGSLGKTGAALLTANAALRAGAGIATIASWPAAVDSIERRVGEVMTARLDPSDLELSLSAALDRRAAVAIGPGLGLDDDARRLTDAIALGWSGAVVIDADAIVHLAGRPEALRDAPGARVLTPHAGELAQLLGKTSAEIEADRFAAAREAAAATNATVVLKGNNTIVATQHTIEVCLAGNPVLATAGSGDVLTGIVAAILCHAPAHDAAAAGVYLHALAADRWRDRVGADRGMVASDISDELPAAVAAVR